MGDIIFLSVMGLALWIVYCLVTKRSIIPFVKKKEDNFPKAETAMKKSGSGKAKNEQHFEETEPDLFEDLLDDVIDVSNHLVHLKNNRFLLFAEVEPCNYFLRSQDEQEGIDSAFESWLATLNYPVQWYIQSRYIDLSEPIDEMRTNMVEASDIPINALEYGKTMLEDLTNWQTSSPRYEAKRYIVFSYEVNLGNIEADSKEERAERIEEKAWSELYRRYNNARSSLRKANMNVQLLTTEGILEVFYHAFNRKKALKFKFKNIRERENLSLYSTADQKQSRVEYVKELIKENEAVQ
ncbi:hypothetical protein [Virgibacillus halodenitrificans]|uniref:hypothetical protein n=1 Tax=Virgibacillus halodenitrificans TaxID=1482 RepID=UPI000EF45B62|nr:hypothetical protein [Virgibacillus halodenitrificans]